MYFQFISYSPFYIPLVYILLFSESLNFLKAIYLLSVLYYVLCIAFHVNSDPYTYTHIHIIFIINNIYVDILKCVYSNI